MAEPLDLLSKDGFVEEPLGPLRIRTAAIVPPAHPLGPDYAEPHWAIWACEPRAPFGWICLFNTPEPDADLEKLGEEDLVRAAKLSALIGAAWVDVVRSADRVRRRQETALHRLPPHVYHQSVEELLSLRTAIRQVDPLMVATLIDMTYHWQTDPGGTRGPRFAA